MIDRRDKHDPQVVDFTLNRFVDGDLRPDERATVAALLSADADAMARASDYQRQNVLLQALYPSLADDAALPSAGAELAAGVRRGRRTRQALAASVALLALVGAGVSGWQAQQFLHPSQPQAPIVAVLPSVVPGSTASTITTSVPSVPGPDAEVVKTVAPSLAIPQGASQVPVHPPNLRAVGYQLVDGRADVTSYGPVIRFAYEPVTGTEGTHLSLAVAAFGGDRQSLTTSINPQHTSLFWRSGSLMYALSGNADPAGLLHVLGAVRGLEASSSGPDAAPVVTVSPQAPGVVEPAVESPVDQAPVPVSPAVEVSDPPKDT